MNNEIARIRELHLFAALSDEQFEEITRKSRTVSLEKAQTLFKMGDAASSFFVLTEGSVKLSLDSPQGVEKVFMIVRPFDLFAEAVMFMEKHRYPVNATAVQASKVVCFDSNLLVHYLRSSPDLSLKMLSLLSVRLHRQINEIETLSSQNSTSRVLNYLASLISDDGSNRAVIALGTSKKNLASRLSITPETLSRVLTKLTQNNILEIDGKQLIVPDIAKYRSYLVDL